MAFPTSASCQPINPYLLRDITAAASVECFRYLLKGTGPLVKVQRAGML